MPESKNAVKTKVLRWLDAENRPTMKVRDPVAELNVSVAINSESINVIFNPDKRDSLLLGVQVSFSPLDKQAFTRLQQDKKNAFIDELVYSLIYINVEFVIIPNLDNMEAVRMSKNIYFDALTKDKLFDSILLMKRAVELVRWCYNKHLSPPRRADPLLSAFLL
jgi:hypothetical protein